MEHWEGGEEPNDKSVLRSISLSYTVYYSSVHLYVVMEDLLLTLNRVLVHLLVLGRAVER